jgi:hypothetical protein
MDYNAQPTRGRRGAPVLLLAVLLIAAFATLSSSALASSTVITGGGCTGASSSGGGSSPVGCGPAYALTALVPGPAPAFTIEKLQRVGAVGEYTKSELIGEVGRTVNYEIVVTNTGNVPMTFSLPSGADPNCENIAPSGSTTVEPFGGRVVYHCEHTLLALDKSPYENVATITGIYTGGEITKSSNTVLVNVSSGAPFTIEKLQRIGGSGAYTKAELTAEVGQTISYEIVVKNIRNETLTLPLPPTDPECEEMTPAGPTTVAPAGGEAVYHCKHTLTAADTNPYRNVAVIAGQYRCGELSQTSNSVLVKRVAAGPAFTIEKLQRIGSSGEYTKSELTGVVGQTINYEIVVTNTGNVPLTFSLPSAGDPKCEEITPAGSTTVAPLGQVVYHCKHILVTADKSPYENVATITGTYTGGEVTHTSNQVFVNVPPPSGPAFTIEKLQRIGSSGEYTRSELTAEVGQTINYEIVVTNTGNAPLTFASPPSDPKCEAITPTGSVTLATFGSQVIYFCKHTLTTIDKSPYENVATITGTYPGGEITHSSNEVFVKVPSAAFTIEKLQRIGSSGEYVKAELSGEVGQTINYEIIVKNTGEVPLTFSSPPSDPRCEGISPTSTTTAAPLGQVVYTCKHTLTATDKSPYENVATITGTPPSGLTISHASNEVFVKVLPEKLAPAGKCKLSLSSSVLRGARGVKRRTFKVSIRALGIEEITFYLDGRKLKTLKSAQAKHGRFTIKINPRRLRHGAHRVSIRTVTTDPNCPPIKRSAVFVKPRRPVVKLWFTG